MGFRNMVNDDKLYILMQELNRANRKGLLSRAAMERVLAPLAGMNEKRQDAYAEEMIPVLRTSGDEEEVLVRMQLCMQLISEGAVMDREESAETGGKPQKNTPRRSGRGTAGTDMEMPARKMEMPVRGEGKLVWETEMPAQEKAESANACGARDVRRTRIVPEETDDTGIYLYRFTLPVAREEEMLAEQGAYNGGKFGYVDNPYPCGIFDRKELSEIEFSRITIFYGGNGSGKSTLLNLIANRLELNRVAPYNTGEMFGRYCDACEYALGHDEEGFALRIPSGSRIITSDDVFDYMLTMRTRNDEISEDKQAAREDYARLKYGESVKFRGMDDYEALRQQVLARSRSCSRRQFIRRTAGEEEKLSSNGETALAYFQSKIKTKTLYCLDEPENSLSPAMQLELVKLLEKRAREEECQLILATHSPFLLAMQGARIYDLDSCPARVCRWWELENVKIYYEFFKKHSALFL